MAQFNIDSHISTGRSLQWLAIPDEGERPIDVRAQVRKAARAKFGDAAHFNAWSHTVASNGYITVRMAA